MNVNVVNTAGKCRAFAKGLALAPALRFPTRKLRRKHKKQPLSRKICERNWNVQINLKREKKKVGKENSRPFRRKDSRMGILSFFLQLYRKGSTLLKHCDWLACVGVGNSCETNLVLTAWKHATKPLQSSYIRRRLTAKFHLSVYQGCYFSM